MNQLLNKITKNFILNEGKSPTFSVWIQSLQDNLNSLRPKTTSDKRRVELMKHQLTELRRITRRMDEQIKKLEEEVNFLQENKNE
jgi:chromosome segregation ATPase